MNNISNRSHFALLQNIQCSYCVCKHLGISNSAAFIDSLCPVVYQQFTAHYKQYNKHIQKAFCIVPVVDHCKSLSTACSQDLLPKMLYLTSQGSSTRFVFLLTWCSPSHASRLLRHIHTYWYTHIHTVLIHIVLGLSCAQQLTGVINYAIKVKPNETAVHWWLQ